MRNAYPVTPPVLLQRIGSPIQYCVNEQKTKRALSALILFAVAGCWTNCPGAEGGAGYVFYKEQGFYPDSRAVVKEVVSYESFPAISRAKTKTGQILEITAGLGPVFLSDPNASTSPADVGLLIKQLVTRYPQHRALLERLSAVCKSRIDKMPNISKGNEAEPAGTEAETLSPESQGDYCVVLLDGTKIENAKVTAITDKGFSLVSDSGIRGVKYESIDLNLSRLPVKAKEKAQEIKFVSINDKRKSNQPNGH